MIIAAVIGPSPQIDVSDVRDAVVLLKGDTALVRVGDGQFAERLQARDKAGLLALVLENAPAENVGCSYQFGAEMHRGKHSWFEGATTQHPEWPEWIRWEAAIVETAMYEGEPIVLMFHRRKGVDYLEIVVRLTEDEGKVASLRSYSFCPEVMREVGEALGHRVNTGLYRYPTPAPGGTYKD